MKYLKKYENAIDFNAITIAGEITKQVSKDKFFEMVDKEKKIFTDKPIEGQSNTEEPTKSSIENVIEELIHNYITIDVDLSPDQEARLVDELKRHYLGPDAKQPLN
jgi:hypothetical protein